MYFGSTCPIGSCMDGQPTMTLRFIDEGTGSYVADESHRVCIPDVGPGFPCGREFVATIGGTKGVGTMEITRVPVHGEPDDYEGRLDLSFDLPAGRRTYGFNFVAPICAIE